MSGIRSSQSQEILQAFDERILTGDEGMAQFDQDASRDHDCDDFEDSVKREDISNTGEARILEPNVSEGRKSSSEPPKTRKRIRDLTYARISSVDLCRGSSSQHYSGSTYMLGKSALPSRCAGCCFDARSVVL